ncbi:putative low molecular weight protein-tyrosine-phosphatase slr0328 isoform X3 [Hibiscus syriacus]|uniref:putative low molecular weight protein-tyrosine-phosphatase slr0328 isoform X3 n=1 Tax=Hibiscus syriacus TaxID=106335 RepID=UPI001924668C|nr:putative low molecular weight protein-tyrosine-phosphatase slr0328 isoform X3 [Hibiscus syriacus]
MRPYLNNTTTRLPLTATPPYSPFCHHSHFLSSKTSSFIPLFHSTKYPSVQNPKSPPYPLQKPTNSPAFRPLLKASMASTAPSTGAATETKPFSVLFVCLGNICRSPAAEGVFRDIVKKKGLDSKFNIDSAGTINYHEGNMADPRMRAASKRRGIEITSISRPIRASDFSDFDLILAMDKQNREDILKAFNKWKSRDKLPADAYKKVRLMCSYCKKHNETEVPDPYYGGPQGFEKVLDLLEDACESLLDNILAEDGNTHSS